MSRSRTETTRVTPIRVGTSQPDSVLDVLAWLMDRSIRIPGTRIRMGLDPILGLLPLGGDVVSGIIQTTFILMGIYHYKVPRAVLARMAANVLIDTTFGSIPVLGTFFDIYFKANVRNLKLLQQVENLREQGKPVPSKPSIWYLVGIATAIVVVFAFLVALFVVMLVWLFGNLAGRPVI